MVYIQKVDPQAFRLEAESKCKEVESGESYDFEVQRTAGTDSSVDVQQNFVSS